MSVKFAVMWASMFDHRLKIVIDRQQLLSNVDAIAQTVPHSQLMPIVKANAYGHGANVICQALDSFGFPYFGFAAMSECHAIHALSLKTPLFLLSEPGFTECPIEYTYTVYSQAFAAHLNQLGEKLGCRYQIHIKVDIGMHRLGVPLKDAIQFITSISTQYPFLECTGVYAHMPCSEDAQNSVNQVHIKQFNILVYSLPENLKPITSLHLFNSGGITHFHSQAHSLVRVGGELYRDVMEVSSYVMALQFVSKGDGVGYDFKYRPTEDTIIAVVACGYADGYSTTLGGHASVLIAGQRYPVVGKICMDMFFVDLGLNHQIEIGENVVIIGKMEKEEITSYDLSSWSSLNYREITCGLGNGLRSLRIVR